MEFNLKRVRQLSVLLLQSHKSLLWLIPGALIVGIVIPLYTGGFTQLIIGVNRYPICKLGLMFSASVWCVSVYICYKFMGYNFRAKNDTFSYQLIPASTMEKFITPLFLSLFITFGLIFPLFMVGSIMGDIAYMSILNHFVKSSPHYSMHDIAQWGVDAFFWSNPGWLFVLGNLILIGIPLIVIFILRLKEKIQYLIIWMTWVTNLYLSINGDYALLNSGKKIELTPNEHAVKLLILSISTILIWVITYKVFSKRQIN
jgi:hypothetical protein